MQYSECVMDVKKKEMLKPTLFDSRNKIAHWSIAILIT